MTSTVTNLGDAAATAVRVSFFVSPVDATPGAGLLIGTRLISTLPAAGAAAATSTATTMLTLPTTLDVGSHFLSAVVDLAGTVAEGDEGNNGLTAPAQLLVSLP